MPPYITRIAPSPTGDMHIGTARTAYFNYLAARATGGRFILRIDDTDVDRNRDECITVIDKTMKWLGLDYDDRFQQSARTEAYKATLYNLIDEGLCVILENGAVALKWHPDMPRKWHDEIAGDIAITDTNIEQIDGRTILMRGGDKLGQFTYQFCSVVDDWMKGINFIIRGVDHITNTAKQVAIWWALNKVEQEAMDSVPSGWRTEHTNIKPLPKFAHVGLIFKDKKKMSKRDGAASMLHYMEQGYSPDALLNFMFRMGWGPKVDDKSNSIITRDRAPDLFLNGGTMRGSNAGFDQQKLDWYNKQYKKMRDAA